MKIGPQCRSYRENKSGTVFWDTVYFVEVFLFCIFKTLFEHYFILYFENTFKKYFAHHLLLEIHLLYAVQLARHTVVASRSRVSKRRRNTGLKTQNAEFDFILGIISNSGAISYSFRDKRRPRSKNAKFSYPAYNAPGAAWRRTCWSQVQCPNYYATEPRYTQSHHHKRYGSLLINSDVNPCPCP